MAYHQGSPHLIPKRVYKDVKLYSDFRQIADVDLTKPGILGGVCNNFYRRTYGQCILILQLAIHDAINQGYSATSIKRSLHLHSVPQVVGIYSHSSPDVAVSF